MLITEDATVRQFNFKEWELEFRKFWVGNVFFQRSLQNYCHVKVVNPWNTCNLVKSISISSTGQPFAAQVAVMVNMIVN